MYLKEILHILGAAAACLLAGCVTSPGPRLPAYAGLPVIERVSPNFGVRRPNYVILHHTADNSAEDSLRTLTTPRFEVSSHYLIARDGTIYYLVDELARAWHAGEAFWGGNTDLNSASIGIELDNNGNEPFAEPMIDALLGLLADIKARYKIPAANFIGHGDIIPGRKVDPSRFFPWKRLADAGFGLWCDSPYGQAPAGVTDAFLLTAFGFDIFNLPAALAAFRRHFLGREENTALNDTERGLLNCLIARKSQR